MNPKQGHSYNPAMKDHKQLLHEVVEVEEKIIQENLKDIKKTRPLLFAQSQKQADGESEESLSQKEKEESEESDDSEDVDQNKPLAVNAEIDRTNIKTQAQRNKIKL